MSETKTNRIVTFFLIVMFLFGTTVGYIVRDVRADEQISRAATDVRDELQALALEAMNRTGRAAADIAAGARAAAESTKAAVDELTGSGGHSRSAPPDSTGQAGSPQS